MRASACSPSMDGRETCSFYFIVCVLHVVSANSGSTTPQEGRRRQQRAQHQRRMKIERKSTKSRSEITEKPSQIDEKSLENRSWPVLGVQARFRDASGRVRDATWTRQSRLKSDLGTPRARQERPGDVQERARDGPKTLPGPSGAMSECVRRDKQSRTRHRNVFSSFLSCRAKAPMCCSYQFLQCFVGFERCKQRTRARSEDPRKSRRFGPQNRARERPGDLKSSPGGTVRATKREKGTRNIAIFWKAGASGPDEATKSEKDGGQESPGPECAETWYDKNVRDERMVT